MERCPHITLHTVLDAVQTKGSCDLKRRSAGTPYCAPQVLGLCPTRYPPAPNFICIVQLLPVVFLKDCLSLMCSITGNQFMRWCKVSVHPSMICIEVSGSHDGWGSSWWECFFINLFVLHDGHFGNHGVRFFYLSEDCFAISSKSGGSGVKFNTFEHHPLAKLSGGWEWLSENLHTTPQHRTQSVLCDAFPIQMCGSSLTPPWAGTTGSAVERGYSTNTSLQV